MAATSSNALELVVLGVETHLGARYVWPDMPRGEVEMLLSDLTQHGRGDSSELVLSNVSRATAVIPWRIVRKITVDDKERWVFPA